MSRILRLLVVVSVLAQQVALLVEPAWAKPLEAGEDVQAVAEGLVGFAEKLDGMAFLEELGEPVPLTAVSPSDRQALDLSRLFGETLGAISTGPTDADALKGSIEGAGSSGPLPGIAVSYTDVSVADVTDAVSVSFSMSATRSSSLPLRYYTEALPEPAMITAPLDLSGGAIDVTFQLSSTFQFGYDTTETDPDLAFYLHEVPRMDLFITASGPITGFKDILGFTDIDVNGVVTLGQHIVIDLVDPDDIVPFTQQEWTQTATEDLLDIHFEDVPDVDDVHAFLSFNSNLVIGSEDGSLSLVIPDLSDYDLPQDPLPEPDITLTPALAKFTNVGAGDVLAGLGQFAIALRAAQITNDVPLPYLAHSLSGGVEAGRALFDLVRQQGDALIRCGPANTVPPSGDPTAGGTIYCQCFAPTDPIDVTWSVRLGASSGTVETNASNSATVGVRPTANVTFQNLSAGELPPIQVAFEDEPAAGETEGEKHTVTPRVRTAQELLTELQGLDGAAAGLTFDPLHPSMSYTITMSWNPDALETALAFGDQLRQAANLANLQPGSAAGASFDVDTSSLDVTFGVILVDDVADITPDDEGFPPRDDDRFFIAVGEGYEFEIADLATDVTIDLLGNIGYLEVEADGDASANPAGIDAYEIIAIDAGAPVLGLDILPRTGGVPISATSPISNAILVRSVLSDTRSHVDPMVNLKMSAGLAVSGALSAGDPLSGEVAIEWPDMSTGQPEVTPDYAYRATLQRFDVAPTVEGFHNGIDDSPVLTDTSRSFLNAFGLAVDPGDHVKTQLFNDTDGSSCSSFLVTGEHTLTCAKVITDGAIITATLQGGFAGVEEGSEGAEPGQCTDGTDNDGDGLVDEADPDCDTNDWDEGDRYRIPGDPQALGSVVLQNLYALAAQMTTVSTGTWSTSASMPVVGVSTKELVPQFGDLTQAIADINAGVSAVNIVCTSNGANVLDTPANIGDEVTCQATVATSAAIHSVNWTAVNSYDEDDNDSTATVGTAESSATEFFSFRVSDYSSFYVSVEVTDEQGITRHGRLPQGPPLSLRELELALESALGIPPEELTFELIDLENPAAGETLKHLVLRLGIDGSGTRDVRLRLDLPDALGPGSDLELVGEDPSTTLPMTYTSHAQLDLGIPLSTTLATSNTVVLDTTGASLTAGLDSQTADITATLGALTVRLGAGVVITGTHKEQAVITGTHTSEISSTTTLTDTSTGFAALPIRSGVPVTNTTDVASCSVVTVTANSLMCPDGLSGGHTWDEGEGYTVIGPSATTLHDTSGDFTLSKWGTLTGTVLLNKTDGVTCTVGEVRQHELVCENPLPSGHRWHEGDVYQLSPTSTAKFDADFSLSHPAGGPFDVPTFIAGLETSLTGPDPDLDCGDGVMGDACVHLAVGIEQSPPEFLGILTYSMQDIGDTTTVTATVPSDLKNAVANQELEWSLLPLAVPELRFILDENLDGTVWGETLPLVGEDLAAGLDFDQPLLDLGDRIDSELDLTGVISATEVMTAVHDAVVAAVWATSGVTLVTGSAVSVTVTCKGGLCDEGHLLGHIDEVQIDLDLAYNLNAEGDDPQQGCVGDSCDEAVIGVPFDVGLPGLPLTSEDELASQVGWKLQLGFGLSRDRGPYLAVGATDDLKLGARVEIDEAASACTADHRLPEDGLTFADGHDGRERRCINGVIGFLEGSLYDGHGSGDDDSPSYLDLLTTLNIEGDNGYLTFGQLMDGTSGHTVKVAADASIDLSFTTKEGDPVGFPVLVGTFHLTYASEETTLPRPASHVPFGQPEYKHVYMDPSAFFGKFIGPMTEEVQKYTKPFQPVIDTITAPIPVVSDLSEAVGQGAVSLLTLLEAISGNDLSMIQRVADFITFLNNMPSDDSGIFLALGPGDSTPGSFAINTTTVMNPDCGTKRMTGDMKFSQTCTQDSTGGGSAGRQWQKIDTGKVKSGTHSSGYIDVTRKASGGVSYGNPGISFPFLNDSMEIFGMLLGEDADLLYVDLGTFSASAGVSWSFGPFFAGPVPLSVNIGGSVTLTGRFAVGFDTRGIRSALEPDGTFVDVLIDGIYLADYDVNGNEVPEVKLILSFWAGASVGFKIFEAGLSAGADFTISLDLNDPNNDGKMRIDEIVMWRHNPICLFAVKGTIEFFLKVYLQINLFFFTKKFEWELYRTKPPIQLFEVKCEPPQPVLAQKHQGCYWLNVGDRASYRNVFIDETKEKVTVRQLTGKGEACGTGPKSLCKDGEDPAGTWISVNFQGIQQEFKVPTGYGVCANAGSGNDVIKLLPGGDEEGNEIPFTLATTIWGGDGDDEITTGEGNDTIYGDGGNDKIYAQGGDDTIYGGAGNDIIEGKTGDDVIHGDGGDDMLNGGPGKDLIYGGAGNDILSGGPGLPPDLVLSSEDDIIPYKDFGDILVGGPDDDELDGGFGDDWLFGDNLPSDVTCRDAALRDDPGGCISEADACDDNTAGGKDQLTGGKGDDYLFGGGGHDLLTGGERNDFICGNAGNDSLDGGEGGDQLYGGDDHDALYGRSGHDRLYGGEGDDLLRGGDGNDDLVGGSESDALLGEVGQDILVGDGDRDSIGSRSPEVPLSGREDILALISTAVATETGTAGSVSCALRVDVSGGKIDLNGDGEANGSDNGRFEGYAVIVGQVDLDHSGDISEADTGAIGDVIVLSGKLDLDGNGTADDEGILAGVGTIGSGNADCIYGDVGNDYAFGGPGNDRIYGDAGTDFAEGNEDDDWMRGGPDDDEMYGNAGSDTMYGDSGDDHMFGGSYESGEDTGDIVYGNAGNDIMVGDNGTITSSSPHTIQTSDPENGGDDLMYGNGGDDIILGGSGNDTIWGNTGDDIILGDNGIVTRTAEAEVQHIATKDEAYGGVDTIEGNQGEDIILGGSEGDTISGDEDDDIILGDNGAVVMASDPAENANIFSTDPEYGGSDTISGGEGDDIILGGSGKSAADLDHDDYEEGDGGDSITGDEGADIILGDNGYITRTVTCVGQVSTYEVERIATIEPCKGGNDTIAGNEGRDIILGGNASDYITGGAGDDTILGDNGVVVRADGSDEANDVYSTDPTCGGSDVIAGNEGDDIILGGSGGSDGLGEGGDTIEGDDGNDLIFGDNATIVRNGDDKVEEGWSTHPTYGGMEIIQGNDGDDIVFGGQDGDHLWGDADDDVILGDHGAFDNLANDQDLTSLDVISSTYPTIGGSDLITAGLGADLVFGGTVSDTINGNEGDDILLGDHGLWDSSRPLNQQFVSIFTSEDDEGGPDIIHGNEGHDIILGQQGDDVLYGDEGDDDITGGHNAPGGADGHDTMFGESDETDGDADGSGGDVMLGDNGVISRTLVTSTWVTNTFNGTLARVVELYDVEMADSDPITSTVYGNDRMWGNDNDDILYGQNGDDEMHGGAGDDTMEGNAHSDLIFGGPGDDDMLGGSGPVVSDDPSTAIPGRTDQSTKGRQVPIGTAISVTVSLGDEMYGGEGSDVMLGDNGIISRPLQAGQWVTLTYSLQSDHTGGLPPRHPISTTIASRVDRVVIMVDTGPGVVAGSDLMYGGPGDDDLYGQFDDTDKDLGSFGLTISATIGDQLHGEEGEDAMVGDQGVIVSRVVSEETQWIEPNEPFIDDHIFIQGTLFRETTLEQILIGGDDRMSGGNGADWMHGGAADDLMNGNAGNDRLFGGDGNDVLWGGPHHDHLWGGWGDDYLDVRPRPEMTVKVKNKTVTYERDPEEWFAFAEEDHYQGIDYVYGGWNQDAMQADVADVGPVPGDRLLDWVGAYNVYYLCPGLYGEFVVTRDHSPAIIDFLQQLARGDGAADTATDGSSGFRELAMVFPNQGGQNAHPVHADNPGHFVCWEPGEPTVRVTNIEMSAKGKGGSFDVMAEVLVQDQTGNWVEGAAVSAEWTSPDGTTVASSAVTDRKGGATFTVSGTGGSYKLEVTDVSLPGHVFDAASSVLIATLNTSGG